MGTLSFSKYRRRYNLVLKQGDDTNTRGNSNYVSMSVADSNGLIETCVALKDSVTYLTIAVSSLTVELTTLREKVAMLEMRLYDGGPAAKQVDAVIATTAEIHEQSTNYNITDSDEQAAQQADAVIVMIAETQKQSTNNTVTVPTSVSSSQLSYADVTSHTTTNADLARMSFAYPVSRDVGLEGGSEYKLLADLR